jgi:zinc transport system substrate-binding protein
MFSSRWYILLCYSALVFGVGACREASSSTASHHPIAVSNAFLEAAACDLLDSKLGCYALAGPRMCPGHFDLRPGQMADLRQCKLLLRFDFQQSLDRKLEGLKGDGLDIVSVEVPGGLCEPDSYLAACRQISRPLVTHELLTKTQAEERLRAIDTRMANLTDWCRQEIERADLKDKPVLTSGHQAAFCRRLGLNVVGTFSSAEAASSTQIDRVIKRGLDSDVIAIIANRPEGTRLAERLAERLNAPLVVFDNFPVLEEVEQPFDRLVRDNVNRLLDQARS